MAEHVSIDGELNTTRVNINAKVMTDHVNTVANFMTDQVSTDRGLITNYVNEKDFKTDHSGDGERITAHSAEEVISNQPNIDENFLADQYNVDEELTTDHEVIDEEFTSDHENFNEDPNDATIEIREPVKLYSLSDDDEWIDSGLGRIMVYVDDVENTTTVVVYAESDGSVIFRDRVVPASDYRKQQERFIILTQGANTVLGVNFQENQGCDEVWETICRALGRDPSIEYEEEMAAERQANAVEPDNNMDYEEMLDLESIVVSSYEREILSQLIDIVNRLVSPQPMDKLTTPDESHLLDLCAVSENLSESELQQLQEIILYFTVYNNQEAQ